LGAVERLNDPRLLKLAPGIGAAPIPRKPFAVVPVKVELLKLIPAAVAEAPGAQPSPKQPFVKPAIVTSSARAVFWFAAIKNMTAKPSITYLAAFVITDNMMWILPDPNFKFKILFRRKTNTVRVQGKNTLAVFFSTSPATVVHALKVESYKVLCQLKDVMREGFQKSAAKICCKSRRSRRMAVAHRFIGDYLLDALA
jgi:hypothetical protein